MKVLLYMSVHLSIYTIYCILGVWTGKIQRVIKMDPGETAVSVHLIAGVWGLLAPGLLASEAGYAMSVAGEMR